MKVEGQCLCEAVQFSFEVEKPDFYACHCSICRKWGGGPALCVAASGDIDFQGEDSITLYASSDWANRGFCSTCGTNLFYQLKDMSYYSFNLETIEGHEKFQFASQVYIDHKPGNYDFSNNTQKMTEEEVLASFGIES